MPSIVNFPAASDGCDVCQAEGEDGARGHQWGGLGKTKINFVKDLVYERLCKGWRHVFRHVFPRHVFSHRSASPGVAALKKGRTRSLWSACL